MSKPRSNPVCHILRDIPNKAARDDRAYSEGDTCDPHPLQAIAVGPATAHLRAVDHRFGHAWNGSYVLRGSEVRADEELGLCGGETGGDGVLADVQRETGGEFVDEDVVVDCVSD